MAGIAAGSVWAGSQQQALADDLLPQPITDTDFIDGGMADPAKVELGRLLFFDPILSGNRNTSCATCHHPRFGTGDGLSLSLGEGGVGLGPKRTTGDEVGRPVVERVPRNAPPIFALGHKDVRVLFHDGRVALRDDGGFESPAGNALLAGLDNLLAVQAMFPVTSVTEMAGQAGENAVADAAVAGDLREVWRLLAERVISIGGYRDRLITAFGVAADELTFAHIANAIAAFEIDAWRSNNTPFDRFLAAGAAGTDPKAMGPVAPASVNSGIRLFYGKAGCSDCHSGPLLSDMQFHAIGTPQVGPGKGQGENGIEDLGRGGVTGQMAENYAFRTPPLRNVAVTGPYMHNGVFRTLAGALDHHLDALASLDAYTCGLPGAGGQLVLPSRPDLDALDCVAHEDALLRAEIATASELSPVNLTQTERRAILAFLAKGLTDKQQLRALANDLPDGCRVPSGLPVDGC